MVVEKLPEVNPTSGTVPGRGLLMLSILVVRRWRNRSEIAKKCSVLRGFGARQIYRRRGAARGPPGSAGASLPRPRVGPRPLAAQAPGWPPGPPLGLWKVPVRRYFIGFFRNFWSTFNKGKT